MIARNSLFTGSLASLATIFRHSSSGRPARMPRTMTSTESAKACRNLVSRRFLSQLARLASMSAHRLRSAGLGGVERGRQAMLFAVVAGTLPEARPADAGRTMAADQAAVRVLAQHLKDEHVLGDDDIAFHAHH